MMWLKNKIVLWAFDHKCYWLMTLFMTKNEIQDVLDFMDESGLPKFGKIDA